MAKKPPSVNEAKRLGQQKAAKFKSKSKPKFTAKQFVSGMEDFSTEVAHEFIELVEQKLKTEPPDLAEIQEKYAKEEISTDAMAKSLKRDDAIAFVVKEIKAGNITTKEVFTILEYGRKDENVLPKPFLRKIFDEFRETYEERVKEELTGKN